MPAWIIREAQESGMDQIVELRLVLRDHDVA